MNMNQEPEDRKLKRTGALMLFGCWLVILGMLTVYFGRLERKAINPNQEPTALISDSGVKEVILQRNRSNHYLVRGSINGKRVDFLLDTGATDVVVPSAQADRLGLERGLEGYALTANGRVRTFRTRISHLQIGNIVLRDVRASINTGMQDTGVLLGMSALKNIEFTQRGDELILRQPP